VERPPKREDVQLESAEHKESVSLSNERTISAGQLPVPKPGSGSEAIELRTINIAGFKILWRLWACWVGEVGPRPRRVSTPASRQQADLVSSSRINWLAPRQPPVLQLQPSLWLRELYGQRGLFAFGIWLRFRSHMRPLRILTSLVLAMLVFLGHLAGYTALVVAAAVVSWVSSRKHRFLSVVRETWYQGLAVPFTLMFAHHMDRAAGHLENPITTARAALANRQDRRR